jgi:guanylate kinase
MLVLVGPSASGKTESAKIMMNKYPISRVVTCTTRPKRLNEIDGFDYHFLSAEEFLLKKKQGYFIETTFYNHYHYGTPKNELADNKFIILDPKGLESFLDTNFLIVAIFLKTKEETRKERMIQRKDALSDIKQRIKSDRKEFDLKNISGLDLIIDTTDKTLPQVGDLIYQNYLEILERKKNKVNQLSLFEEDQ